MVICYLLLHTCRIAICDSNAEHCLGLVYKLNQPLKVSKLIFHASQKIFFPV